MSLAKKIGPLGLVLMLSGLLFVVFLAVTGGVMMSKSKSSSEEHSSLFSAGEDAVGVIELNGVIMDSKRFLKQLEKYGKRKSVKAVVVRINSPGGAVAPSQEIYEAVRKFEKPIVASMGSVAASGGYYVACGAKKVFANPGTITGSIGVIMQFANLSKLYDWAKIERFSIKTGKFKDAGADYRAMDAEERALLQGMIDDVLGQFTSAVEKGRGLQAAAVKKLADGRIFSGAQAKASGMVDELGTLEDAVAEAGKLAGIKGKPKTVYPDKASRSWIKYILEEANDEEEDAESSSSLSHSVQGWASRVVREALGLPAVRGAFSLEPGVYWLWTPGN